MVAISETEISGKHALASNLKNYDVISSCGLSGAVGGEAGATPEIL